MSRTVLLGFDPGAFIAICDREDVSVPELARVSGVGSATIYQWRSGRTRPSINQLRRVATTLARLRRGDEEVSPDQHERDIRRVLEECIAVAPQDRMLAYYRQTAGFTQPDLAAAIGIPTSTLAAIERAEIPLNDTAAEALADALWIDMAEVRAAYARSSARPLKRRG